MNDAAKSTPDRMAGQGLEPGRRPSPGAGLPVRLMWALMALCLTPLLFRLAGFDLGLGFSGPRGPMQTEAEWYRSFTGAFMHTLLEGAAAGLALTASALVAYYYSMARTITAPILALALLVGGLLDGFHILASNYMIGSRSPGLDFIPATWSLSRTASSLVLVLGVIGIWVLGRRITAENRDRILMMWAGGILVISALAAIFVINAPELPRMIRVGGPITRPWDVPPLVLYVLAAALALPRLLRRERGPFIQSVWLSMLPSIASQAYQAFGSLRVYDHYFVSAHYLKLLSYAVPLIGLVLEVQRGRLAELDSVRVRTRAEVEKREAAKRLAELEALNEELEASNRDLEQFAYIASHDLRAPLRAVTNLSTWLAEDFGDDLTEDGREYISLIQNRVARLDAMVESLLKFARVGSDAEEISSFDSGEAAAEVVDLLEDLDEAIEVRLDPSLPEMTGRRSRFQQVLLNLLSNACRFAEHRVSVSCRDANTHWEFVVSDDGRGISPEYHERIWGLFTRLESRDEDEGTGLGLALVKRIVESWRGRVWVESEPGAGASFYFTLPKTAEI